MSDQPKKTAGEKPGDKPAGGDGLDPNAQGKKPDAAADGGNPGGDDQKPSIYRPKDMPDHFLGANDQETIDRLNKAYMGARSELAGKNGVPEKLDDYKIELPEEIASVALKPGEDGKDAIFEGMRGTFHQLGIAPEKAQTLAVEFYKHVAAAVAAGKPPGDGDGGEEPSADFEYKALGGADKAKPVVDATNTFLKGLQGSGKISEATMKELQLLTFHSDGLQALNELRPLMGEKPIPFNLEGGSGEGKITEAMLNDRVADPRYRRGGKQFSQEFYDKTTEMFAELYGTNGAG
jgi:hypothetical protein